MSLHIFILKASARRQAICFDDSSGTPNRKTIRCRLVSGCSVDSSSYLVIDDCSLAVQCCFSYGEQLGVCEGETLEEKDQRAERQEFSDNEGDDLGENGSYSPSLRPKRIIIV